MSESKESAVAAEATEGGQEVEPEFAIDPGQAVHSVTEFLIDELKAAPDCWQKMSEGDQDDVIERASKRAKALIRELVHLVSFEGEPHIPVLIDKLVIGDKGIQGTFSMPKNHAQRHQLVDLQGQQVDILLGPWSLASQPHGVQAEANQKPLDLREPGRLMTDAEGDEVLEKVANAPPILKNQDGEEIDGDTEVPTAAAATLDDEPLPESDLPSLE